MRLTLPYPISANRYWVSFYAAKLKRVCVGPTGDAKAYKAECGWLAKQAGYRQPTTRQVIVSITLVPKNGIVMDLDNCLKVSIDALKGIVYVDDKQVREIHARYGQPDGKGALIVDVTEISPEQQAMALPAPELAEEPF